MPGEAASFDLVATTYGTGMVFSDNPNVHVNAMIIDVTTIAANEAASIDASQGGFDAVRIERDYPRLHRHHDG